MRVAVFEYAPGRARRSLGFQRFLGRQFEFEGSCDEVSDG